jgi:hypothetical protein
MRSNAVGREARRGRNVLDANDRIQWRIRAPGHLASISGRICAHRANPRQPAFAHDYRDFTNCGICRCEGAATLSVRGRWRQRNRVMSRDGRSSKRSRGAISSTFHVEDAATVLTGFL